MQSALSTISRFALAPLVALSLSAFGNADAAPINFQFTNLGSAVYTPCDTGNCFQGSGFGLADDVGDAVPGSWASSFTFNAMLDSTTASGSWQFFDVGATSTNDLSGTFAAMLNPNSTSVATMTYTVTGGNGLFAGATGSGSSSITLVDAFDGFADFSEAGSLSVTPVPEPSTTALMLAGLAAFGYSARRRRSKA